MIVVLNLSSRDIAKTLSAVLRCRVVKFNVFDNLALDQLVSVSPRLVGPYNDGGGFQVLWSNAKRYVCSLILLKVGGFGFNTGVARVLPGWLDASLNSGINDAGERIVFRGGCKESVNSIRGTIIDVFAEEDVLAVPCGVEPVLADCCGDVADQSELCGDCIGCTRKCSCFKLKSCLC